MNRTRLLIIFSIVVVVGGAAALIWSRMSASQSAGRGPYRPLVAAGFAEKRTLRSELVLNGDVQAVQQAAIFSRVAGVVLRLPVDIGDYIHAGELLAVIDSAQYAESVRQSHAALVQAEAAKANADATVARVRKLVERDFSSKQDLDNAEAAERTTAAQVEGAKAALANARLQLYYCRLTAPFSGYVTKRYLDPGGYVATFPASAASVVNLMDISKVKVFVSVPERDITLLDSARDATVRVDALPGRTFTAKIARTNQALDPGTRTLMVELDIDNPDRALKPGMFATATIGAGESREAFMLSETSVQHDSKGAYVFVILGGRALRHPVVTGRREGTDLEVVFGISAEDSVITLGVQLVKDSLSVRTQ